MKNVEVEEVSSSSIEADLARIEAGLRQLKIQYDMFFAGAIPRQPFELRTQLDQLVKRCSNAPIRKYAHRFHLNALVSRYNSLSEHWTKSIRALEEGDRPAPAIADRHDAQDRTLTTCRLRGPQTDETVMRTLHECFVEARRKSGVANPDVNFDAFVQGITNQARAIREKNGCSEVELRLVVEHRKVQLKAKPGAH